MSGGRDASGGGTEPIITSEHTEWAWRADQYRRLAGHRDPRIRGIAIALKKADMDGEGRWAAYCLLAELAREIS